MVETSGGDHPGSETERPATQNRSTALDWAFHIALGIFALPLLTATVIIMGVFSHGPPGLPRALWGMELTSLAYVLSCRILLEKRLMQVATLVAACINIGTFGTIG